jgi:hypothetical protein
MARVMWSHMGSMWEWWEKAWNFYKSINFDYELRLDHIHNHWKALDERDWTLRLDLYLEV